MMKSVLMTAVGFLFTSTLIFGQLVPYEELEDKYLYKSMEEALNDPTNVICLELKGEDLVQLDLAFSRFVNLQYLDLSKNNFADFPKEITKLEFLQHLDLSKNEIKDIPDEIENLKNLKYLGMSRNRLYLMSPKIGELKKLEELDLYDNPLNVFPDEMAGMASLKKMDLRVVQVNDKNKKKLMKFLPYTDIKFSKTCNCD